MFRSLFGHSAHAGFRFAGKAARLAALAALTLGALPYAAEAQSVNTPLRAYFAGLTCQKVSNDNTWPRADRDEPYVVIFTADLRGAGSGNVIVSQEFADVNTGTTRNDWHQIWSPSGYGSSITSNEDYLFLAALMESDNSSNRMAVRNRVANVLIPKLAQYKQAGASWYTIASNLMADMNAAIEASRGSYSDADDRVGTVQGLQFAPSDLQAARSGQAGYRTLTFGGSDSRYLVRFEVRPEPIIN